VVGELKRLLSLRARSTIANRQAPKTTKKSVPRLFARFAIGFPFATRTRERPDSYTGSDLKQFTQVHVSLNPLDHEPSERVSIGLLIISGCAASNPGS
jgi:hypothetical protein